MTLKTEFEFTLPKGYMDDEGTLQNQGTMRLATVADEVLPLQNRLVQQNPAYVTILVLAQVVTKLGTLDSIDRRVIENLYSSDLTYLRDFYNRINKHVPAGVAAPCPQCGQQFEVAVTVPDNATSAEPN